MPFIAQNWAVISQSTNIPQKELQDGTVIGAPGEYTYQSRTETLSEIASDVTYFSPTDNTLFAGDLIYIVGSDAAAEFTVLSVDPVTKNVIIAQDSGSGNVIGPGSSTDNAVVRFNGISGQLIQNSLAILSDAGVLSGLMGLTSSGITYPTNAGAPNGSHVVYDGAGSLSLQPVGGGGDVFGPASSNDNRLARFDGTSGKLIQNSLVSLSDIGSMTGLTNFQTSAATIGALIYATVDGSAGDVVTTDGLGNLFLNPIPTNPNHVVGPASATDNAITRFDGTTGKLIQNSVAILSDAGALSGLTGLVSSGLTYPAADGTNGQVVTTNGAGVLTFQTVSGNVTGPASATDNALCRFDGTTGKLIQNSIATLSDAGALAGLISAAFGVGPVFQMEIAGGTNFEMSMVGLGTFSLLGSQAFDFSTNGNITFTTTADIVLAGGTANRLNGSTTYVGPDSVSGGSHYLNWINALGRVFGFRAPAGTFDSQVFEWPATEPSPGEVLSAGTISGGVYPLDWVAQSSGGYTTQVVTSGTPVAAVNLTQYVANSGSLVQIDLPASPIIGFEIRVIGYGGGWKITIGGTGDVIHQGIAQTVSTTIGVGGISATNQYDDVTIVCIDNSGPNIYKAISPTGTLAFN